MESKHSLSLDIRRDEGMTIAKQIGAPPPDSMTDMRFRYELYEPLTHLANLPVGLTELRWAVRGSVGFRQRQSWPDARCVPNYRIVDHLTDQADPALNGPNRLAVSSCLVRT
jgi:hypothetical protein